MNSKPPLLTDKARTLLTEILSLTQESDKGPVGPPIDKFRIKHKKDRPTIDALLNDHWLERAGASYRLRLNALAAISHSAASEIFNTCSQLYVALREAYEARPNQSIPIRSLAEQLRIDRKKLASAITYLSDAPVWGGYSTDLSSADATVQPSEGILDYDSFDALVEWVWNTWGSPSNRLIVTPVPPSPAPTEADRSKTPPQSVSISAAGLSDAPASMAHDALGYRVYAEAIVDFLTHENTQPPFSLAITGPWGSGKTTLLRWIRNGLKQRIKDCRTVWFSPWKHNEQEEVWAAFARTIIETLLDSPRQKLSLRWQRLTDSFSWRPIWLSLIGVSLLVVVIALSFRFRILDSNTLVGAIVIFFAFLAAVWPTVAYVWRAARSPLLQLLAHSKGPDYDRVLGFHKEFEKDLNRLIRLVTKNGIRLYVFVDDLDRAPPPVPVKLLEAMNLLIGQERCIFVVGLDLDMVAASIEAKYLPVIQRIESSQRSARAFSGRDFIEKLIQLEFALPAISSPQVDSFLDSILQVKHRRATTAVHQVGAEKVTNDRASSKIGSTTHPRGEATVETFQETEGFVRSVHEFSACLPRNPRKIKRFINCFRLLAYIAARRGLFERGRVEIEYLGAITVLVTEFPELYRLLSRRNGAKIIQSLRGFLDKEDNSAWGEFARSNNLWNDIDRYRALRTVLNIVLFAFDKRQIDDYLSLSAVVDTTASD